jgi:hypothetical protein
MFPFSHDSLLWCLNTRKLMNSTFGRKKISHGKFIAIFRSQGLYFEIKLSFNERKEGLDKEPGL